MLSAAVAGAAIVLPLSITGPAAAAPAISASSATSSIRGDADGTRASGRKYERKVRAYTNKARKNHHRKVLHGNKCVDRFANRWARKMARRQQLAHQALGPIIRRCDVSMAGENIAYGYPGGKSVVRAWMHSEGHRANILRRRYRLLGVGVKRDRHGQAWVSQVFARR